MTVTRVLRTAAVTLSHTWLVGEDPTDPTGTPTYAITDANGTSVSSGNATVVTGEGRTTAPFPGQSTMKHCTVTWTATVDGTSVVEVDYVEVVGGFFFTLAEGRASDRSLSDATKFPSSDIELRRLEVEVECEEICDRAFVPRYRRVVLDGSGSSDLVIPDADIRTLRRASQAPTVDGTFVDLSVGELAAVAKMPGKVLRRTDGNIWTEGFQNIVVEYEYGSDRPPADLVWASKQRLRSRLNMPITAVPDRAISFQVADGGSYRLSTPDAWKTGIPDVDAVYGRYSLRSDGTEGSGSIPASRTLTYNVQRHSIYH